jgi:hypothetical protein
LLGDFEYDDDDDNIVQSLKVSDLFYNQHVTAGERYMSADIALTNDSFVMIVWSGLQIIDVYETQNIAETHKSIQENGSVVMSNNYKNITDKLQHYANKYAVPRSNIVYDADGIGHNIISLFPGAVPLHTGMPAINKEYFNLKSELYFRLADLINNAQIYINCEVPTMIKDRIITELTTIKRDSDVGEKLKIKQKSEIKRYLASLPILQMPSLTVCIYLFAEELFNCQ